MEIILTQPVKGVGKPGEKVKVKDGYARNFLIPNRLALEVTVQNVQYYQQQEKNVQIRLVREKQEAEELAKKLSTLTCTMAVAVGEQDRLFGAVTAQNIASALKEKNGITLDKRAIDLPEAIKQLGVFTIAVRLHPDVKGFLKVSVVKKD